MRAIAYFNPRREFYNRSKDELPTPLPGFKISKSLLPPPVLVVVVVLVVLVLVLLGTFETRITFYQIAESFWKQQF